MNDELPRHRIVFLYDGDGMLNCVELRVLAYLN